MHLWMKKKIGPEIRRYFLSHIWFSHNFQQMKRIWIDQEKSLISKNLLEFIK